MSASGQGKGDEPRGCTEPSRTSRSYTGLDYPEDVLRIRERPRCALSRSWHGNRLVAFQQTRQKPLHVQPRPLDTRRHRVYKIEGFRRTNTPSTPSITHLSTHRTPRRPSPCPVGVDCPTTRGRSHNSHFIRSADRADVRTGPSLGFPTREEDRASCTVPLYPRQKIGCVVYHVRHNCPW